MTDAEISKNLALAIGWRKYRVYVFGGIEGEQCKVSDGDAWHSFDYRDPAVIWPIAEAFKAFPMKYALSESWLAVTPEVWSDGGEFSRADTAAKAVALAVINSQGGKT